MIVPMKKYSILLYHKDLTPFLSKLQDLGLLHIIETAETNDIQKTNLLRISQKEAVLKFLRRRIKTLKASGIVPEEPDHQGKGKSVYDAIVKLQTEYEQINQHLISVNRDIKALEPWGEFGQEDKKKLEMSGLNIRFYRLGIDKLTEDFKEKYICEIISTSGNTANFIVLSRKDVNNFPELEDIKLPESTLGSLIKERESELVRKKEIDDLLDGFAWHSSGEVEKAMNDLINETMLEKAGMNSVSVSEDLVKIVQGWIPEEKEQTLLEYLDEEGLVYIADKPSSEEMGKVPILLKNNGFAKLFEPIARLFSLPSYTEIDLTAFFAPFYMMFFGLCLGDAGYGVVMIVAATAAKFKIKKADMRAILTLVQFLGLATVIAGAITGTIFGVTLAESSIIKSAETKGLFLTADEMFNLSIAIGLIQIIFGLLIKAFNITKQNSFIAALPTLGWVMMIIAGITAGAFPEIKSIAMIFVWIGLAAAMLFSTTGNIFKRLGLGIWDMYNNITGVFGDTLSYIRLFALGLSGSILGLVINNIGEIFLDIPYVGWLVWLIFLLVGHTGNLLLCSLGSFVHPMRLTFVEFYKNAGWTGGGKEYKPFKKNA
ncbi:MAG TPA: V-type ATPase 116kDa subunit family protein [Clostridiales bacterium]|nr:V-type ATPase 116kDa subunit family protein [Clostridiales bacterium]HQP70441.1 V-type ATPase 116kDa subunit family protein [Clostridiales bacterium]